MEISELRNLVQTIPDQGYMVSQIEAIKIECSLKMLQNQMKAEAMFFFGKIYGIKSDYYLAFSTDHNRYIPSIFYCSSDCVSWFSITRVDDSILEEAIQITEPFSGQLISEFQTPAGRLVTEEQRLASVMEDLYRKCFLFPRGYLCQTALEFVLKNPMWTGLSLKDCSLLSNFRHWVPRESEQTPLERALSNPALDFTEPLDSLEGWRVVQTADLEEVQLRSLAWPGFLFSLRGESFVNCYFGRGVYEGRTLEPLPVPQPEEEEEKAEPVPAAEAAPEETAETAEGGEGEGAEGEGEKPAEEEAPAEPPVEE